MHGPENVKFKWHFSNMGELFYTVQILVCREIKQEYPQQASQI
jgi:hypothetical protein